MPQTSKKRSRKASLKKKKLLTARLIRISMVIDDYVYKNKAVSTIDAKAYVEEVSLHKQQCRGDMRSLQVIEKITRCMNSIIAEQEHNIAESINSEHPTLGNYCPSPVYSLPDEDKTMLTQTSNNIEPTNVTDENSNDMETIDLTSDRNIEIDVEIHRAMSNLSITDGIQNTNNIDCSQSILNDFNANRKAEIRETETRIRKPNFSIRSSEQEIDKNCSQSVLNYFNANRKAAIRTTDTQIQQPNFSTTSSEQEIDNICSQSILSEFNPNKTKFIKYKAPLAEKTNTMLVSNKPLIMTEKENIPTKNNVKRKKIETRHVNFNKNTETIVIDDDTVQIKKKKQKAVSIRKKTKMTSDKKVRKLKKKIDEGCNQESINIFKANIDKLAGDISLNDIHITLPIHNIRFSTSMNESVHQRIQSTNICGLNNVNNSIYNKSIGKIYNKNINNNFSWIENIRYVREISNEEFDSKYGSFELNFWENFSLPNNFNESFDFFA